MVSLFQCVARTPWYMRITHERHVCEHMFLHKKWSSLHGLLSLSFCRWGPVIPCSSEMLPANSCEVSKALSLNLNFSFLNRISLLLNQVATQFSSRGWTDPVPDPILSEKFQGYSRESNPGHLGWALFYSGGKSGWNINQEIDLTGHRTRVFLDERQHFCLSALAVVIFNEVYIYIFLIGCL